MKILGISGSSRPPEVSGVYRLVEAVLNASGNEYELISLRGKTIGGCIACMGCVADNVCKVRDDMEPLREKIAQADAYVIGAPNYYTGANALTHALLERLYQFRHQEGDTLWGKLAVAVGVGGTSGQCCCADIERFMAYNFIETIAKISGQGAASCYTCGYGETCKVGVPAMLYGPGTKITEDMIPDVTRQPEVIAAAERAGKLLAQRLSDGHDRSQVTRKMQAIMMEKFKSST
jgi:multimeric flavodoxin WrbA